MQAEEYEVEEILDERTYARGSNVVTEYKVKWKGYSYGEATWEPITNLDNCKEVMRKYQEKKMARTVPRQKTNTKEKSQSTQKPQINIIPQEQAQKGIINNTRSDLYFQDQSNANEKSKMDEELPQESSLPSLELPEKVQKQSAMEKGKRGRKKKEKQEEPQQNSNLLKVTVKTEPNKPMETIPINILQKVPSQQTPVCRPIRTDQFTVSNIWTQTSLQTNSDSSLKVVSKHSSFEFPGKVWFTVEQKGKYTEISREQLIWSDPKALYNFYHGYYVKGVAKSKQMQVEMMKIMQQKIQGRTIQEESDQNEDHSMLDYFTIAKKYDPKDRNSRSNFEKLIRNVTAKPKTDKSLI